MSEHPTVAEILMVVHDIQVKNKLEFSHKPIDEKEFEHSFSKEFGVLPQPGSSPDGFREAFEWAEKRAADMRSKLNKPEVN